MSTSDDKVHSSADSQMTGMTLRPNEKDQINDSTDNASTYEKSDPEQAAPPAFHGHEAPDGGLTAWLVVLGAWCTSFCSFGWVNSVGAFQEYYQNDMLSNYSPSTIAWIPSLQIFFMMGSGPVIGSLYDNYGPRQLILIGSFLHVFGIMMTSLAHQYWQILLAQGVCSAIGAAAIFQPAFSTIHGWFNKKRGAAFGILATGSSIGGVIFPIMVTRLIRQVGYGWAMRICAFIILALLIVANLTVRAIHPPRPQKVTKAQFIQPFREYEFIFVALGFFFFTYGIFVPINYLPVQALAAGMRPSLVEYLIPILNALSLFGRIFSGIMGDRIGRFNIFIAVGFMSGILILALWIPCNTTGGLIAFAALFGFSSGAYVSLIAPLVAQVSPLPEIGVRTGLVLFICALPGLTTNPINGEILAGSSGLTGIKIFAGVFCLAGTICIVAARVHKVGWGFKAVF